MFVPAMTFEEIRKEYERERMTLATKAVALGKQIEYRMRIYKRRSVNKFVDYVSPRKNCWLMHITCDKKKKIPMRTGFWGYYFKEPSYAVVSFDFVLDMITYYKGHFFTRFYERTEVVENDTPVEIIKRFALTNRLVPSQYLKEVRPGVWQAFTQFTEGVGLGYFHQFLNLLEFRTFINNQQLKGDQIEMSKMLEEKFNLPVMRNMKDNDMAA